MMVAIDFVLQLVMSALKDDASLNISLMFVTELVSQPEMFALNADA